MVFYKYPLLLLTVLLGTASVWGQSTAVTPLNNDFRALVESDGRILGLDYANGVFASEDGGESFSSLSILTSDANDTYYTFSSEGDTVIAVGTDGLIARSSNQGTSWNASVNSAFLAGDLKAVAGLAGNSPSTNLWISVGVDGSDGVILTSSNDGVTWTESERVSDVDFSGATWTGSAWLVCGFDENLFEGVVYRSTDRVTWSRLTLPTVSDALLAVVGDGAGNVIIVGEGGVILRSTNHGQTFSQIGSGLVSDFLYTVVMITTDSFVIGGGGKSLLETNGSTVTFLHQVAGGAPAVEALLLDDGAVLAGGAFAVMAERTIPIALAINLDSNVFQLTVEQTFSGKTYTLQTSNDLQNWTSISGSTKNGTDGSLQWFKPEEGSRRFWRALEF